MRVLIFYNTAWYIYIFRRNLINELQAAGCRVIAVAPDDEYAEKLRALGVEFLPIPMAPRSTNPLSEIVAFVALAKIIARVKPEYVLSFTIKCNLYAGLCSRLIKFKQVANVSGLGEVFDRPGSLNSLVRVLYRAALRNVHTVFFQNREDREHCVRDGLVPADASRVIPGSGVDLSHFAPQTSKVPESGQSESNARCFLQFGRLLPRKGYSELLDAAEVLHEKYGERVQFWILGKADSARPESMELLTRIKAAHERGVVRYFEPTDNVLPILNAASAVVLPSTYNEGIPRSLLEALACGKPIVTTDWKGCRETVVPGRNGFLVRPGDTNSLREALESLITCDDPALEAMGRASRNLAETRFDEAIVLSAYLERLGLQTAATRDTASASRSQTEKSATTVG